MYYGIKQVIELKNKDCLLYKVIDVRIDKYLNDPSDKYSFEYVLLTDVFKVNNNLDIYFCCSNNYYDAFAGNISVGGLKTKIPLLYHALYII